LQELELASEEEKTNRDFCLTEASTLQNGALFRPPEMRL
jgi:hypothetical protein